MSQILSGQELLKKPHDPFWDGALTRREAQRAFDKLGI
jgi:hypothetical protein